MFTALQQKMASIQTLAEVVGVDTETTKVAAVVVMFCHSNNLKVLSAFSN